MKVRQGPKVNEGFERPHVLKGLGGLLGLKALKARNAHEE